LSIQLVTNNKYARQVRSCAAGLKALHSTLFTEVNDGKTEFLIIGTRQQPAKVNFIYSSLRVGNTFINSTDKAKNVGFWFDPQMELETNISKCSKAAFSHLFRRPD
jgi:hypothetical protein